MSERSEQRDRTIDEIAEGILQRAMTLMRLFIVRTQSKIARAEADVLVAVCSRPRRITGLAAREGVTQPCITRLVTRLEGRGWVKRDACAADGRVVLFFYFREEDVGIAMIIPGVRGEMEVARFRLNGVPDPRAN